MSRVIKSPPVSEEAYHVPEAPSAADADAPGRDKGEPQALDFEAQARRKLQQAEAEARAIVEQAQAESGRLLAEARSEAERLKALAREEGHKEGRRQGQQEIELAMKAQAEAFEQSVFALQESLQRDKERLVRKAEPQLIELACTIAGRVVRKEIEQDNEAVMRIVQKAIALATEKEKLRIRLNPADVEWVRQHCQQLMASHDDLGEMHFEEDPRIERGGCIVETVAGNVDARLERQLEELRRSLQESS